MKIERTKLLSILEQVKPGISSKELMASMSYLFFSGENLITYNDKISVQHPFKTDFSLFTKAIDFYKLVSKATSEVVNLTEKDEKLVISSNKFKASLSSVLDAEVKQRIDSVAKSLENIKWKKLPDNFSSSILLCSFTASNQESDGMLKCVNISKNHCVSSDNNRISKAVLSSKMKDDMFILASEIKNLTALNPVKYCSEKSWIHFKNKEGCIFSVRTVTGEFPDFMQFFDFEGIKINLPKEIIEGVDLTSILLNDEVPLINVKISKNKCILSIKSDAGKIQHKSKLKYSGKEINFPINPEFLKEMIKHSSLIIYTEGKVKLQTESGFSILTALYK